jgi:hypothetical protein
MPRDPLAPLSEPGLLPSLRPVPTTPGVVPIRPAPVQPKIWQPPNVKVTMPVQMPTIGKPGKS